MAEATNSSRFIYIVILTLESAFAMIDYCRNHTFDKPTNNEPLHFSKENSDQEFGIYDKFKCLHCCSHGYRSIEWFKDGRPYPWPTDVSTLIIYPESGNQTIYSQQLTPVDSGRYWCVVRNDTHFLQHDVTLKISGPSISMGWPRATYRPRDQRADFGEPARFYCEAFVGTIDLPDFRSEISWERYDSNRSFINGERVTEETVYREEKRVLGSYLIFNEVRYEDYGEYTCKVKNFEDQVVELSAWLNEKVEDPEYPIYPHHGQPYQIRASLMLIALLILTAIMSTITFLRFGSYFRVLRNRIFQPSSSTRERERDILVIYHDSDAEEAIGTIVPALRNRYHYSCSLHPLQSRSQIGEEDLKAKANSYKGLLALMTPSLVGGGWSCESIHFTVQALLKVHFTVICIFLQHLPLTEADGTTESRLLKDSLSKVHYVERSKGKDIKFWDSIRLKLSLERKHTVSMGSLQELI